MKISKRFGASVLVSAAALSGCYVVPVGPDGNPAWVIPIAPPPSSSHAGGTSMPAMTGEATRVSGEERKGIASAYGPGGSFMSCEYQMHTPAQGAGICIFSNGAKYKVHIGN